MTSIQARTVRRGLTSKGFDEVDRGDVFYHLIVNGKKSGILVQLVECPLSREEYESLLRERGKL